MVSNDSDHNTTIESGNRTLELQIDMIHPMEAEMYKQISCQTLKMSEVCWDNQENMSEMMFEVLEQRKSVEIATIDPDGNCIFGALVHQLFQLVLGSEEHKNAVSNMRNDVVEYIKSNLDKFKSEIVGCIYNQTKTDGKIKDFKAEAKCFLDNHLSKDKKWGGRETLKAVSLKYNANIMVIDENGAISFFNGFQPDFERTLLLAYRLNQLYGVSGTGGPRNHYDSIANIDAEIIIKIAETLAANALVKNNDIIVLD